MDDGKCRFAQAEQNQQKQCIAMQRATLKERKELER
jgi:hypothetical protein